MTTTAYEFPLPMGLSNNKNRSNFPSANDYLPLSDFTTYDGNVPASNYPQDLNGFESSDFTVTSGWNRSLFILLIHGIVSFCWGIALLIFSLGVVPISWGISTRGINHPEITNVVITLVATTSTTHISYTLHGVVKAYSHHLLAKGFTLSDLQWMQGVQESSLFTKFPGRKGARWTVTRYFSNGRLLWIIIYLGVNFHSSSLVAILQPQLFFDHIYFPDTIPCGQTLNNLTLDAQPSLSKGNLQNITDFLSFNIGMQLGGYGGTRSFYIYSSTYNLNNVSNVNLDSIDQVAGNSTTSITGRTYTRDRYGYGAIGGLQDGLLEVPGAQFDAQCSDDPLEATTIWKSAFANRRPPVISPGPNGTTPTFTDDSVPTTMRSIASNIDPAGHAALYALTEPSGRGALLSIGDVPNASGEIEGSTLVCSWTTTPITVHIQISNWTATALSVDRANTYPTLIGRSTWMTLQGIARAYEAGFSLQLASSNPGGYRSFTSGVQKEPYKILENILADGSKASLTLFNDQNVNSDSDSDCPSNIRTVQPHWKFGNSQNLGWVAVIWTIGIGGLAMFGTWWMSTQGRIQKIEVLGVAEAFVLGRGHSFSDDQRLCVKDGKIQRA